MKERMIANTSVGKLYTFFNRLPRGFRARMEEWDLKPLDVFVNCIDGKNPLEPDGLFEFHKDHAKKYFSRGNNDGDYPECLNYLMEAHLARVRMIE